MNEWIKLLLALVVRLLVFIYSMNERTNEQMNEARYSNKIRMYTKVVSQAHKKRRKWKIYLPNILSNQLEQCNLLFVWLIKGNWAILCHRCCFFSSPFIENTINVRKHSPNIFFFSFRFFYFIKKHKKIPVDIAVCAFQ